MAEVDTSSYPKLPANPPSFLDTAGKLGTLQQQQLTIQQQQLNLIKDRFQQVAGQIPGLLSKPDLNEDDIKQFYRNNVANGYITPEQAATKISQLPPTQGMPADRAALTLKNHMGNELQQAMTTMDALHYHLGGQGTIDTGQQITPTLSSPKPGFAGNPNAGGVVGPQRGIPVQPPPTQPIVSQGAPGQAPRGTPGILGPSSGPTGLPSTPGALPVGPAPVPQGMRIGNSTVTGIDVGPDQPNMGGVPSAGLPTKVPTQRFTQPITTGLPPGASEAMTASGAQLASDRIAASSFQRDIFPLVKAIPALETLGTKGTGPGTDTLNQLRSFILSNVPGATESNIPKWSGGTVKDYDEAKKYLTDFVNQTGNSGTNDKLAAAFAGNPSTHISNAAAIDVAKSALALRRMKQAQLLTFEQSGLPESEYARWNAQTTNQLDPRAFGVDLMSPPARAALLKTLQKAPASERANFEKSLQVAQRHNFITPPSGTQ